MTTQTDAIKLAIESYAKSRYDDCRYGLQESAATAMCREHVENLLAALQEQAPDESQNRCEHGVWKGDHCYSCGQAREGEAVTVSNEEAHALAEEWHGQAGGRLAPQLTDNEVAGMLAQFATDRTKDWPQWMQDNARVATASFPKRAAPQPAQPDHIPDAGKMVAQPEQGEPNEEVLYYAHRIERALDDVDSTTVALHRDFLRDIAKLVRTFVAQPVAQPLPLTDERIAAICLEQTGFAIEGYQLTDYAIMDFARAIESAHGIGSAL